MKQIKQLLMLVIPVAFLVSGCYKDDIDELKRKQKVHTNQILELQKWHAGANKQIQDLKDLINTLDYVTDVTYKMQTVRGRSLSRTALPRFLPLPARRETPVLLVHPAPRENPALLPLSPSPISKVYTTGR